MNQNQDLQDQVVMSERFEQHRVNCREVVLRADTNKGRVYVKLSVNTVEGRLMKILSKIAPCLVPEPLCEHSNDGWVVMKDYGTDFEVALMRAGLFEDFSKKFGETQ